MGEPVGVHSSDLVASGKGDWTERPNVPAGGDAFAVDAWEEPKGNEGSAAGNAILELRKYNRFRRERRAQYDEVGEWVLTKTGEERQASKDGSCWTECRTQHRRNVRRCFHLVQYVEWWRIDTKLQRYYEFMDTYAGDAVGAGGTAAGGITTAAASGAAGASLKAAGGALGGAAVGAPLFGIGVFALTTKYYGKWFDDVAELISGSWAHIGTETDTEVEEFLTWERCSEVVPCGNTVLVGDPPDPGDDGVGFVPGGPLGGPSPAPSPDPPQSPSPDPSPDPTPSPGGGSWPLGLWLLLAAVLAALVGGWLLFGGGGGDGDGGSGGTAAAPAPDAPAPPTPAPTPPSSSTPPPVAAPKPLTITAIVATFDQATFTTSYTVEVTPGDSTKLGYTWWIDPEEDCGVFTWTGAAATWTHPHESQRGQPGLSSFPEGRFCKDTTQQQGGHPARIFVNVGDTNYACEAVYIGGSEAGRETDAQAKPCERVPEG